MPQPELEFKTHDDKTVLINVRETETLPYMAGKLIKTKNDSWVFMPGPFFLYDYQLDIISNKLKELNNV